MQRSWHDKSQVKITTNLGEQAKDKEFNWLVKKRYPVKLELFCGHVQLAAQKITLWAPEQAGNTSFLNAGQRQIFDHIVDHYLYSSDTQLLIHIDSVTGLGKSTVIDIISSHFALHAMQQRDLNPVFCATSTRIATFNIYGSMLYQLFRLLVN